MTVSEVAAAGVASLMVPFPHAVDDHQTTNARFLSDQARGAADAAAGDDAQALAREIASMNRAHLSAMAVKARNFAEARGHAAGRRRLRGDRPVKHKVKQIHFVGIGGAGMSGIAEVLLNLGYKVSGSDLSASHAPPAGSANWAPASPSAMTRPTSTVPTWS
jgi:hypothetical protein